MIPLAWDEIEALALGELDGAPVDGVVRRVHDDSRDARPGDLFVALNTGVRFVDDARARGAATLLPRDQEAALAALASARPRAVGRAGRRGSGLGRQDDDEGRPRRACARR